MDEISYNILHTLSRHEGIFSLIIDARELIPMEKVVFEKMASIQAACSEMNCIRTAIITESPVLRSQAAQISFDAKTNARDLIIDASKSNDWMKEALNWVEDTTPIKTRATK